MKGRCAVKTCSMPELTRKIHEDFEALVYNVCWECGDEIKKTTDLSVFSNVIHYIEEQVK
jgi:hypothetical protein